MTTDRLCHRMHVHALCQANLTATLDVQLTGTVTDAARRVPIGNDQPWAADARATLLGHLPAASRAAMIRARERQPMHVSMRSRRAGSFRDAAVEILSGLTSALDGACQRLSLTSHVATDAVARITSSRRIVSASVQSCDTCQ